MKMKKILSGALSAMIGISLFGAFTVASAADEHVAGQHDFGNPFTPYLESALVLKDNIIEEHTIEHVFDGETVNILEKSAQYYSRDNGYRDESKNVSLSDGSLEDRTYGNVKNILFAYTYEPIEDGAYPAILLLHGGGGTADTMRERAKDFAAKGYVAMAIDIPALTGTVGTVEIDGETVQRSSGKYIGNDNYRFNIAESDGGAKNSNLVDAEVGVIQTVNYLLENNKVDKTRVGLMGSSWGGYSTTLVSGIMGDKIKAAYSQYGSGFYGPTPDGTKYGSFWTVNGYYPTDEFAIKEWYDYLDPSSHLDNIKAHYYMDAAAMDTFFWPDSVQATYKKASGSAASVNHVWSYTGSHKSISDTKSVYSYMDYYLKGDPTAKEFSKTEITSNKLTAEGENTVTISVTAPEEPSSVKIICSTSDKTWQERKWYEIAATGNMTDGYTAVIPKEYVDARANFYALTKDSSGEVYSSSDMKATYNEPITVNGYPTFSIDGATVNELEEGTLKGEISLVNNNENEEISVSMLLGLYKNGTLVKAEASETSKMSAGETKAFTAELSELPADVTGYSVKMFLWDSLSGMKPYGRFYSIADINNPPTTPQNLTVTGSSFEGISLAWEESSDNIAVAGYNVYRKNASDSEYTKLAYLEGKALSYQDAAIEVNSDYVYAVEAVDNAGAVSEKATVTAKSVEGASIIFDEASCTESNTVYTFNGYKMSAQVIKHEDISIENHKPLQDENQQECLAIAQSGGKYIQIKVDDDYINPEIDNRVAVLVTFDEEGFDNIRMQYNSANGEAYQPAVVYKKLNEQRWMTKSYIIEDAAFNNAQSGGYDLRFNFDADGKNYIRSIQIVNLASDFEVMSSTMNSVKLTWKKVSGASGYKLYRNDEKIADLNAEDRIYTDSGLDSETEYSYKLTAVIDGTEQDIKTVAAETGALYEALVSYESEEAEYKNLRVTIASDYTEETIDGVKAVACEAANARICLAIDKDEVSGTKDRLLTVKYNDCGNKFGLRVSIISEQPDRAHYILTAGSGKWETATVLIPAAAFKDNADDIYLYANANSKFAISEIKLSSTESVQQGGQIVTGIASGITVKDGNVNTTLSAYKTDDKTTLEAIKTEDGIECIKANVSELTNGTQRAEIRLMPDYRYLGQDYKNAKFPNENTSDTTRQDGAVRPVKVRVTYYQGNSAGVIYVKGSKLNEAQDNVTQPDNDATLALSNTDNEGKWVTADVDISDYYVCGGSDYFRTPIVFVTGGVPEGEDILISKIEILNNEPGFSAEYNSGKNEAVIDWQNADKLSEAVSYRIYRNGELLAETETLPYTDNDFDDGGEYTYTVTAFDANGNTIAETCNSITITVKGAKIGEYSFADSIAENIEVQKGTNVIEETVEDIQAIQLPKYSSADDVCKFSIAAEGQRDRYVRIKYHDGGIKTSVRVSMVNSEIDGAHYLYTRGTNRWETATVLIPNAKYNNNFNDLELRAMTDNSQFSIASVEMFDGTEHDGRIDNIGARTVSGIACGITADGGLINGVAANWNVDNMTSVEADTIDNVDVVKLVSANEENNRSELRIVPDYRFLGQTQKSDNSDYSSGVVSPVTVRVTYYRGNTNGTLYVKGAKLKTDNSGLEWPDNDGSIPLKAKESGASWETVDVDIDDFYMMGKSDYDLSYIQFIGSGVPEGENVLIKSVEIINKAE